MDGRNIIYEMENEFGAFSVEELNYEGREARVLFSGPIHAAQSGIPLDSNPRLLFDYNQRFLELALDLEPKTILVLGGGTLTLASALAENLPQSDITVVELNGDLIEVAKKYFNFKDNSRINIQISDAGVFIRQKKDVYDLIIVDLYDNFTIPMQFRTTSFARRLRKALTGKGVVATNCIASLTGITSAPLRQLCASYSKAIGPVRVIKVDGDFMDAMPQNLLMLAFGSGKQSSRLLGGCVDVDISSINSNDNTD